jgi:hypothetical protein
MKKFISLFSLSMVFISCSNNDNNTPFFNLSNGNIWVYKRYYSNNNVDFTASSLIDSVRVIGDTLIQGQNYSKFQHKTYSSGNFNNERVDCLRVNSENHLVNQNDQVYHSGTDFQYVNERTITASGDSSIVLGTVISQVQNPFTTTIEGVSYFVHSYHGNFVSANPSAPNNFIYYQYKAGVGLVCEHCAAVSGSSFYEDRLVYYDVN